MPESDEPTGGTDGETALISVDPDTGNATLHTSRLAGFLAALPGAQLGRNAGKAIGRGAGLVFTPEGKVERAEGRAKAKLIDATSDRLAHKIRLGEQDDLADRMLDRLLEEELQLQRNRESIAAGYVQQIDLLAKDREPPDDEIADDFLTAYWDKAEKFSGREIQNIWARLLAEESFSPGSISPMTVHTLSILTPDIAQKFELLCSMSISDPSNIYVLGGIRSKAPFQPSLEEFGIDYNDLIQISAYGLTGGDLTHTGVQFEEEEQQFNLGGRTTLLKLDPGRLPMANGAVVFSIAGMELRNALPLEPHPEYLAWLEEELAKENATIEFLE